MPIVALCAYDWPEYREAAARMGAVAFVPKERVVAELPPAIRAIVHRRGEEPRRQTFTDLFSRMMRVPKPRSLGKSESIITNAEGALG